MLPDVEDGVAEWVAIAVSLVVGVAGFGFSFLSDRRARAAQALAKRANEIAADAVARAAEANEIAEHANGLSADANSIAQAQADQQADPSHIEWRAKWDKEGSLARITNHGRDVARSVSVIVDPKALGEVIRVAEDVPRGGGVVVPFPEVPEKRAQYERTRKEGQNRARSNGVIMITTPYGRGVEFDVRWISPSGKPGQQTVKLHIS